MPSGIAPSDRKVLQIAGLVLLIMLVASVILAPPQDQGSPIPSTYSTQSAGARAAYLLLSELHYPVRRWEEPPTELHGSRGCLLILVDPFQPASDKERGALLAFVKNGGHILFTGRNLRAYFRDAQLSSEIPDPGWKTLSAAIPSRLARGVQKVVMQAEAYWGAISESQLPLYSDSNAVAIVSWKVGGGEILWWAGPTPLTNAGITHEDNLALFLNAVGAFPGGFSKIYWDEYFHGQRSSLWSYVEKTSLVWGLPQLGLVAFAIVFSLSRRRGPIYAPAEVSRLSPLEFVDTLASLYEKAGAASSALGVSYQRLRALLTRQLSLPAATPDAELGRAASQRFGWIEEDFTPLLQHVESSMRAEQLSPQQALRLIQRLERYASRIRVGANPRMEKT
jgi:Domain of unknown function (DUF4350)